MLGKKETICHSRKVLVIDPLRKSPFDRVKIEKPYSGNMYIYS